MLKNISSKKLYIFDLDGTLTESKSKISPRMGKLLSKLLENKKVAVISGGKFSQFKKQLLSPNIIDKTKYTNLSAFPTNSTLHYVYKNNRWTKIYEEELSKSEKKDILGALKNLQESPIYKRPRKLYGKTSEDRNSQITFSAIGQNAPLKAKTLWNKNSDNRPTYINFLKNKLKKFEIKLAGLTSIDINRKGIDKAYGVKKILKELNVSKKEAVFIGDAFYRGGNDAPARRTGIDCIKVNGPKDTENLVETAVHQTK